MADEKLLLVEDNPTYLENALRILPSEGLIVARNYEEAKSKIGSSDLVISDLFYRENGFGSSEEIGRIALERIKYGFVKSFVDIMNAGLVSRGLKPSERLERCFYVLGLALRKSNRTQLENAGSRILDYLRIAGDKGPEKLEEMIRNHTIWDGRWQRNLEESLDEEMAPLKAFMNESPDNYPLGYLVCEEAESLGKPSVLVTSLRHSHGAVGPVIVSAHRRGWKVLEGGDVNKDNPEYWRKAFNLLKGGERENGK